ncbi:MULTISPECIES: hypothetical protein [unclassified Paenibacillus]|uniref:hypothetical protein n=1 Tax=unclassified Paenibacillus TaxID=185978 RepID=UPI0009704C86|nr:MULTISPECIES: hypothetical protein [unclassified Paenibacillus]ASS66822.1 hypothetical protein CIC07_12105 [Paenibacillus sp. RUD330]
MRSDKEIERLKIGFAKENQVKKRNSAFFYFYKKKGSEYDLGSACTLHRPLLESVINRERLPVMQTFVFPKGERIVSHRFRQNQAFSFSFQKGEMFK